ncbi:MAG: hypothetical protein Q8S31_08445 [Alphaproteobacteria bacterium]|nr:hypothetical protein [Alphaproteobacteria bacterium]
MKTIYTSFILSIFTLTSFNAKAEVTPYDASRLIQESQHIEDGDHHRYEVEDFTMIKNVTLNDKMSFLIWARRADRTNDDIVITIKTPAATTYDALVHDAYFVLPQDQALEAVRMQGRTYNEQFKGSYPLLVGGTMQKLAFGTAGTAIWAYEKLKKALPGSSSSNINNSNIDVTEGTLVQILDQLEENPTFIPEDINPIADPLGELLRNIGYFFTPHVTSLNAIKNEKHNIHFVGHGFGGVIAQYLSNKYKKPGFSFASMGLGQFKKYLQEGNAAKNNEDDYAMRSFTNYIRENDAYGTLNLDYYGKTETIGALPLSAVADFNEKRANIERLYGSIWGAINKSYLEARYALMIEYLLTNHGINGYVAYLDSIFNAEMRERLRRARDSLFSEAKEVLNVVEEALDEIAVDVKAGWNTFKNGVKNFFNTKK